MLDMRSYRGPNGENRQTSYGPDSYFLGPQQIAWLKRELKSSAATWKVIAADMPIGLFSEDGIALGDGPPARREHEIANLLSFMKRAGIRNTVWLTADMHYTAAHHYDPNRAAFQDFEPFWEFVSGPLHAGTWAPAPLDNTFGPKAMFQKGCSAEQGENLAPCFGLQFFGRVDIDGKTEVMTVTLKDVDNRDLWSVDIEPRPDARPGPDHGAAYLTQSRRKTTAQLSMFVPHSLARLRRLADACGTRSHLEVAHYFLKEAQRWRTLRLSFPTGALPCLSPTANA